MANIFPSTAKVTPSFTEPDMIVVYTQASGAFAALEGGKPRVKIGNEDLNVYVNKLDIRTNASAGQSPKNELPSVDLQMDFIGTPTYLAQVRAIWSHHDMARAAQWAVGLPAAQDLGMRQGIFQMMRSSLLFGFNPGNGEGLLNAAGATVVTLPPDPYGNTTLQTYDNGAMALFWLGQIVALKSAMYQTGDNIKTKVVVISPQRVFQYLAEAAIVQVTSYQRPGAGTATVADVIQDTAKSQGDQFEWYFDDTLIGQASGNDAVILTIPELDAPDMPGINTNIFGADMQPQMKAVNLMYSDMAAPMKIPTPTPDGAITEVNELRFTSGWNIRSQGIVICGIPY